MNRVVYLLVVPTGSTLIAWILLLSLPQDPETGATNPAAVLIQACIPLLGIASAIDFGRRNSVLRSLWPLLPFAAAALGYLAVLISVMATHEDSLEPTTLDLIALGCLCLQPVLAVAGGMVCVRRLERSPW